MAKKKTGDPTAMPRFTLSSMAMLVLVFFVAETIVMFILPLLPAMPAWLENLSDAGLMVLLAAPALYHLLWRPMEGDIEKIADRADRLAAIVETTSDGIAITGTDGIIGYVNRGWEKMTGWSSEEVAGKVTPRILRSGRTDPALYESLWRTIGQGRAFSCEFVNRRKDGTLFDTESIITPLKDAAGKVTGFSGVERDITERKKAEAALRESELHLRVILEATADGILAVDNAGRLLKANRRFAELWRIPAALLESRDDRAMLDFVLSQLVEPEAFQRKVQALYGSAATDLDTVVFKDGRIFERYSSPLLMNRVVSGRVWSFRDITESRTNEAAAAANDERVRLLLDSTAEGIYGVDLDGKCTLVNQSCLRMLGYDRAEELLGRFMHDLMHHSQADGAPLPADSCHVYQSYREGRPVHSLEEAFWRKDRTAIPVELWSHPIFKEGKAIGAVATFIDITERKRTVESLAKSETNLRQSQKMESVGRLAGGVAHDFNNILTAISGYAGFVMAGLPEGDQRRDDLQEVLAAGERAARLTRQLLAFSRKQILNPEVLDVNAAVGGIVNMLKRLIGEDIKLETQLAAQPCLVKVDAGQIEQVFLNLAVNARDAMPKGGMLTFETGIVTAAEDFSSRHPDMSRGPLVCLRVRDTGCGMTDEVKAHLFEPFFSTKEKGKGTGLGLSMVYGIIRQSGGDIEVESAPGRGTTFRIYLPQIDERKQDKGKVEGKGQGPDVVSGGNETVLLVEDEDTIRRLGARVLTANGYAVLVAADGQAALKALERHGRAVDLLITDVVMPGMSGRELAQELASKNMVRRTLFISGFTDDAIVRHGVLEPGLAFMYKPFSPDALLRRMRDVLDGPADQARA